MNIGILTYNLHALSHKHLVTLGQSRGHNMRIFYLPHCYMSISADTPHIFYREGETFDHLDAIIPRIPRAYTHFGTALLRQLEQLKVFTLNTALSISWASDKLRALQQLGKHHIPIPLIGVADSPEESEKLVKLVGGAPVIIRLLEVPEGKGTIFAETEQAAISVINAFKQLNSNILIQEYIEEAAGQDVRYVIVGDKVVGAVLRTFESQTKERHRIIRYQPIQPTRTEEKIALAAAKTLKLNLAYVDLIRAHRGPLVLDVEGSPNIERLEKMATLDISTPILDFIEARALKAPRD